MPHLGSKKATQTGPGGLSRKMLVFWLQEFKGQFWA